MRKRYSFLPPTSRVEENVGMSCTNMPGGDVIHSNKLELVLAV